VVAGLDGSARPNRTGRGLMIFAEQPWGPGSPAVVLEEDALRGRAPSMPSYAYLLEVDRAAEVLEVWSRRRSGVAPSPEEAAEALVHYAAHDDHLPTSCHHPGCGRPVADSCSWCQASICDRHADRAMTEPICSACSRRSASRAVPQASGGRRLWPGLAVAGVLFFGVGVAIGSVPLWVGGTCVAVVGLCAWLSGLVQRLMA